MTCGLQLTAMRIIYSLARTVMRQYGCTESVRRSELDRIAKVLKTNFEVVLVRRLELRAYALRMRSSNDLLQN